MEKIINGYTKDGQPIWRYETSEEKLLNELYKLEQEKLNNKKYANKKHTSKRI